MLGKKSGPASLNRREGLQLNHKFPRVRRFIVLGSRTSIPIESNAAFFVDGAQKRFRLQ